MIVPNFNTPDSNELLGLLIELLEEPDHDLSFESGVL